MTAGANDENQPVIGAKERLAKAKEFMHQQQAAGGLGRLKAQTEPEQVIPVLFVFCISTVLAFLLTIGPLAQGVEFNTGSVQLNQLLFGPGFPEFMSDPDLDRLIAILVRGGAIFLLSGIIPLFSKILMKTFGEGHVGVYVMTWAVTVILAIAYYLTADMVGPAMQELLGAILL